MLVYKIYKRYEMRTTPIPVTVSTPKLRQQYRSSKQTKSCKDRNDYRADPCCCWYVSRRDESMRGYA